MRKIINGEPHVVHHECSLECKGQAMTLSELHDFAVKTLKQEYEMSSNTVMIPSEDRKSAADLCLVASGKIINIKVLYSDTLKIDLSQIDTTAMIDRYYLYGQLPWSGQRIDFGAGCISLQAYGREAFPRLCQLHRRAAQQRGGSAAHHQGYRRGGRG